MPFLFLYIPRFSHLHPFSSFSSLFFSWPFFFHFCAFFRLNRLKKSTFFRFLCVLTESNAISSFHIDTGLDCGRNRWHLLVKLLGRRGLLEMEGSFFKKSKKFKEFWKPLKPLETLTLQPFHAFHLPLPRNFSHFPNPQTHQIHKFTISNPLNSSSPFPRGFPFGTCKLPKHPLSTTCGCLSLLFLFGPVPET